MACALFFRRVQASLRFVFSMGFFDGEMRHWEHNSALNVQLPPVRGFSDPNDSGGPRSRMIVERTPFHPVIAPAQRVHANVFYDSDGFIKLGVFENFGVGSTESLRRSLR